MPFMLIIKNGFIDMTNDSDSLCAEPIGERYEDVLARARAVFPDCTVYGSDGKWVVDTGIHEMRQVDSDWAGTAAEVAFNTYEANYGSDLERWAYKNGYDSASLREAALAFNSSIDEFNRRTEELRQRLIAMGRQDVVDAFDKANFNEEQMQVHDKVAEEIR